MIWPAMLFNLCVGLLLAGYLLRAVRRFERRADALLGKLDGASAASDGILDRAHEENMRKYDIARDEIRTSLRVQVDAAIAEMSGPVTGEIESATSSHGEHTVQSNATESATGSVVNPPPNRVLTMRADEVLPLDPAVVKFTHTYETVSAAESAATILPSSLPKAEEIQQLPFRARVAFAARCARRVLPLRNLGQQPLPSDTDKLIIHSVDFSERNAVVDGTERHQAGLHVVPLYFMLNGVVADAVPSAVLAVVKAAVSEAYREGGASLAPSYAVAAFGSGDLRPNIRSDFETIHDLVRANNWADETPVPPSTFGPLWPEGPPKGWPVPEKPTTSITIEFDVPDDMTTERAVEFVKELSAVLCFLDLAGGGHGVAIQPPLEITAPASVTVRA